MRRASGETEAAGNQKKKKKVHKQWEEAVIHPVISTKTSISQPVSWFS